MQQRTLLIVKAAFRFFLPRSLNGCCHAERLSAEVNLYWRTSAMLGHHLQRTTVRGMKAGAQNLVAINQMLQGGLECLRLQRSFEPNGALDPQLVARLQQAPVIES